MIRIERNTHNFFSLLQFIEFLINTFTFSHSADAFIQSDLQGNVKIHLVRGIELAILRLLNDSSKQLLYPLYHCLNAATFSSKRPHRLPLTFDPSPLTFHLWPSLTVRLLSDLPAERALTELCHCVCSDDEGEPEDDADEEEEEDEDDEDEEEDDDEEDEEDDEEEDKENRVNQVRLLRRVHPWFTRIIYNPSQLTLWGF